MDARQHELLRRRIREIIRKRNQLPQHQHHAAQGEDGGFLPFAAIPAIASALPGIIDAGKKLFGSGKHKPHAKTHKPNAHALKVKAIMKANPGMSLAEASRLAAQM